MARPKEIREYLDAAEGMKDSMKELLHAWERLDQNPRARDMATDIISKNYPFNVSFDELYLAVIDWVHELEDKL